VKRVSRIVRAMKAFSHVQGDNKVVCNVNEVIETSVLLCKNEWKYVANLRTHFDDTIIFGKW
jgi:hypothetical protein